MERLQQRFPIGHIQALVTTEHVPFSLEDIASVEARYSRAEEVLAGLARSQSAPLSKTVTHLRTVLSGEAGPSDS